MALSTWLSVLLLCRTAIGERIIGGTPADPNELKFMASVQFKMDDFHFCGGSIIDKAHILTSAHCCQTASVDEMQIVAGEHILDQESGFEQVRDVKDMIIHEQFDAFDFKNDLCILILVQDLVMNQQVGRAAIASDDNDLKTEATVYGWGATANGVSANSNTLMKTTIPIVSQEECINAYGPDMVAAFMLCAGADGKDSCKRDTGSPLVCRNAVEDQVLCGTASFGYDCGQPGYPGVYMRITSFTEWINDNIQPE